MGIFNFLKRKQPDPLVNQQPALPENGIQAENVNGSKMPGNYSQNGEAKGIESIYAFLQRDFENKGYNDALVSPDESNKHDNIRLIQLDLEILVQKVETYYKDSVKEIDYHMASRTRAGLIDLVEELKTRRDIVLDHMDKVSELKKEMSGNSGMAERMVLSYQRGFMKGISAITQSTIMNKKI
jgi:hypothetical protein